MRTAHRVIYGDSATVLRSLPRGSVDLLVTSPPYPMIEMWDALFARLDPRIGTMIERLDGDSAHEAMHRTLDRVWRSADSRMKRGATVCVNIGDATRTVGESFQLYPNHSRVAASMIALGYHALPEILWRKQSNKPNKFMGSGMLPPGAYVTQEHEYVMLFRKGDKRAFVNAEEHGEQTRQRFLLGGAEPLVLRRLGRPQRRETEHERAGTACEKCCVPVRACVQASLHVLREGRRGARPVLGDGCHDARRDGFRPEQRRYRDRARVQSADWTVDVSSA